jgi:putative DNA primase/helicase
VSDGEAAPKRKATPTQKAAAAIVASATDDEPHSGSADLSRPHTLTDVGLGRRLAKMIRGRMTYVRERKTWLYWDGRRHADQGEHIAEQHAKRLHDELWGDLAALDHHERTSAVVKFVHESGTRARIAAAIAMAQSEPGINTSQADYDSHPWLLNVRNGVVDLRSGELLPHDPKLRITQLAAVEFVPDARSELWERFIREATRGDDDVAEFLQQSFGLALTGDVSDEVLICHNGGGCNGKSTALEAVGKMLGDYAAVAPPGLFTARKFDSHPTELAGLRGKRFVTAIEQEGNKALRESLIKQMTGGDTIRTRGMREDFWEMRPTWNIHIAYNTAPRLTGTDDGIRRRLRVVPWTASFKAAPDATVKERLTGEGERAGILNWCLAGLRKRLAGGRLYSPEAVMVATDEYIDDEDLIGRFIAERAEIEQGHMIELREMLRAFREWMQADGSPRHVVDGYTANALGRELARRGFRKMRPDSGVHRKQTVVMGLRLVHTADDLASPHDEEWAIFNR